MRHSLATSAAYSLAAIFLLTACATPDQRIARITERCEKIGYTPNTEPMRDCIRSYDQAQGSSSTAVVMPQPQRSLYCYNAGMGAVRCF